MKNELCKWIRFYHDNDHDHFNDILYCYEVRHVIDGSLIYVSLKAMLANGLDYEDAKIIFEIVRKFPTLRGLQIHLCGDDCQDIVYVTLFAYETDHVCRTISHEIIHTIVDHLESVTASIALDMETNGLSLLDRLMRDGYLGGE